MTEFETWVEALVRDDYVVVSDALSPALTAQLRQEAAGERDAGAFRAAGIGRGDNFRLRPDIRSDRVLWVDEAALPAAGRLFAELIEPLRQAINAATYMGLYEFEGHYAVYPPASFYRRHVDQFAGAAARRVSLVLYLNPGWRASDGGLLRLYPGDGSMPVDVSPEAGTLALFMSHTLPHEVLPTVATRYSFTGWYRTRESA